MLRLFSPRLPHPILVAFGGLVFPDLYYRTVFRLVSSLQTILSYFTVLVLVSPAFPHGSRTAPGAHGLPTGVPPRAWLCPGWPGGGSAPWCEASNDSLSLSVGVTVCLCWCWCDCVAVCLPLYWRVWEGWLCFHFLLILSIFFVYILFICSLLAR